MKEEILEKIYKSNRNNIISGDMSTGKTTNIGFGIVEKLIKQNESMFILDSREEYLNKYYKELKEKKYNIIVINLKEALKGEGWNPFTYSYDLYKEGLKDKSVEYLENISKELLCEINSNADPFWMNSACDYFIGITLALFEDANEEEINLKSISTIIDESELDINYVGEYFRTKDKNDMSYVCASGTTFSPIETRNGIIATAKQKLRPIVCRENLNNLLSKTTFNYEDILNQKNAIFFINSETDYSINSLTSIFIKELYNILIDNNNLNKFNFIIDNFDTMPNFNNLIGVLGSCIYHNIKCFIFTRDKKDVEDKYTAYINKLLNSINMTEKKIEVDINGEIDTIENSIIPNEKYKENITYTKRTVQEIKIFNLKKYILENIKLDDETEI